MTIFPVERVRSQFPVLSAPSVFLDSPAGTQVPRQVDERVPTVSITHPRHRSSALAKALAAQGINVWSGHTYAYELAKCLGLDEREGVLRIGLVHYNTAAEVERIVHSLRGLLI